MFIMNYLRLVPLHHGVYYELGIKLNSKFGLIFVLDFSLILMLKSLCDF